jgi:hypothetical protein
LGLLHPPIEGPLGPPGFAFEGRFWPLRAILPVSGPLISTLVRAARPYGRTLGACLSESWLGRPTPNPEPRLTNHEPRDREEEAGRARSNDRINYNCMVNSIAHSNRVRVHYIRPHNVELCNTEHCRVSLCRSCPDILYRFHIKLLQRFSWQVQHISWSLQTPMTFNELHYILECQL